MHPFIVFSLPRSRSAWMAHFLADQDMFVGHDVGIECKSVSDFAGRFKSGLDGSCETGSMFAWNLLAKEIPGIKFVVIRRERRAVAASLARFGLAGLEAELEARDRALDEIEVQPNSFRVDFEELRGPEAAQGILAHVAPERKFSVTNWAELNAINIQVKMDERLARLVQNSPQIEAMKSEARAALVDMDKGYTIEIEPFQHFWPEAKSLAEAHSVEVDSGVEPRRPFKLSEAGAMNMQRAGVLRIFALRLDKRLVGYLWWQICPDIESDGLMAAFMGPLYAQPGHAKAVLKLWDHSVAVLRAMGVKIVFPHHRTQGRGANLGNFLRRRGAKHIQNGFSLWIGADNA